MTQHNNDLNQQLDGYAQQAKLIEKSKTPAARSIKIAAGFGAAASLGLMTFDQAAADIVYSGPQNISLSLVGKSFASTAVDIDLDSQNDFFFSAREFLSAGGPNAFRVDWPGDGVGNVIKQSTGSFGIPSTFGPVKLPANFVVSGGQFFDFTTTYQKNGQQINFAYFAATFAGTPADPWNVLGNPDLTTTGFIGIEINSDQYGWMRIRLETGEGGFLGGRLETLTIIDWAYESTNGKSIRTGQIPEPGAGTTLGLLALGAVGLRRLRKDK